MPLRCSTTSAGRCRLPRPARSLPMKYTRSRPTSWRKLGSSTNRRCSMRRRFLGSRCPTAMGSFQIRARRCLSDGSHPCEAFRAARLAALHSFCSGQELKKFPETPEPNPDCPMAYWGIAMSVWNQIGAPPMPANLKKGSDAITQALALGAKTPRERDYLDALAAFYTDHDKLDHRPRAAAYMRKMEEVAQRSADDREARIFYALSLLATADGLDKTYKNQLKAGEILEQVFAEKPQHPGPSHYIIHAYDYPALVDRALAAAQNYATCVTVVPHAIHMPSHTYVLLGRWQDTITANDAADIPEADRGTPADRLHPAGYLR